MILPQFMITTNSLIKFQVAVTIAVIPISKARLKILYSFESAGTVG